MSGSKHTVGDWLLGDFVWHDFEGGGQRFQELTCDSMTLALVVEDDHDSECPANAALIAAAPELLEALEHLLLDIEGMAQLCEVDLLTSDWAGGVEAARAAITKARGEGSDV